MTELPTCCITGLIAGDLDACGDCDPCLLGAAQVPDSVKRLMLERDQLANEIELMRDRNRRLMSIISRSYNTIRELRQGEQRGLSAPQRVEAPH